VVLSRKVEGVVPRVMVKGKTKNGGEGGAGTTFVVVGNHLFGVTSDNFFGRGGGKLIRGLMCTSEGGECW